MFFILFLVSNEIANSLLGRKNLVWVDRPEIRDGWSIMMKTMTIEEMLVWAFVNELPKGGGVDGLESRESAWGAMSSGSDMMASFAVLGMKPQTSVGSSYEPRGMWFDQGDAHPDALTLGGAVSDLGRCSVRLPTDWQPLSDWPNTLGLAEAEVDNQAARFQARSETETGRSLVALVMGTSILGKRPDWSSVPLEARVVERGGKPAWFVKRTMLDNFHQPFEIEVDGYNPKSGRPVRGAYRKFELTGNAAGDILARLDWQLWIAALRHLGTVMRAKLVEHRLADFDERMTPWQDVEGSGPIIMTFEPKNL
ncbi:hypothetical protein JYU29_05750 [Tianweitania sp. BSSL-BM11]|uniref:Uncharacterized protein n=1 Tax=Tianweitania aestuarii TaxID=2814886 RepID=A0ABS5RT07_9HYPH|nr:hypothetical protein [Tianweitania aestuarii]MBS9720190.1 hypothetical protein [Tianweitania aestuarii]